MHSAVRRWHSYSLSKVVAHPCSVQERIYIVPPTSLHVAARVTCVMTVSIASMRVWVSRDVVAWAREMAQEQQRTSV